MFVKLTKWDEVFFSFTTFEINDQIGSQNGQNILAVFIFEN